MILIFTNGIYLSSKNKFYDNEHVSEKLEKKINMEYDSNGYLIMKKKFNFEFDLYHSNTKNVIYQILKKNNNIPLSICNLVSTYHNDWRNIPTPFFDKLLDSNLNAHHKNLFYIFFGKIFHHNDEKEQWKFLPLIYGRNSFFIIKFFNKFLSNYQLCVGRYGIEYIIPMGNIWLGLILLLTSEGTPSQTTTKILNNILTEKSLDIGGLYNEQQVTLENPKFILIPNLENNFEFDKLKGNILHFEFKNSIDNDIQENVFNELSLIIQKTNQAYIEASFSCKKKLII